MRLGRRRLAAMSTFAGSMGSLLVATLQAVILTPWLLKVLGTKAYGAWLVSGDILLWIQTLDLGLSAYATQKIGAAHARSDAREVTDWLVASSVSLLGIAAVLGALGVLAAQFVYRPFDLDPATEQGLRQAFLIGVACSCVIVLNNAIIGFARGVQSPTVVNLFSVGGALAGFGVSALALVLGLGILSVALGMATRCALLVLGSGICLWQQRQLLTAAPPRLNRGVVREAVGIMPVSGLGSLGYTLVNQSENVIAGYLFGPELAAMLNVTRKFAEMGRAVLDTIGYAAFGAFSHLFAQTGRDGSALVYRTLVHLQLLVGLILGAIYVGFNQDIVTLWVGQELYLGNTVTLLIALQLLITVRSYLQNTLLRAAGENVIGYRLLIAEAAGKIVLIFALYRVLGVFVFPVASILVYACSYVYTTFLRPSVLPRTSKAELWPSLLLVVLFGVLQGAGETSVLVEVVGVGLLTGLFVLLFRDTLRHTARQLLTRRPRSVWTEKETR